MSDIKFDAVMALCKYLLPCGRCEMTRKQCNETNPMMICTIQKSEASKSNLETLQHGGKK